MIIKTLPVIDIITKPGGLASGKEGWIVFEIDKVNKRVERLITTRHKAEAEAMQGGAENRYLVGMHDEWYSLSRFIERLISDGFSTTEIDMFMAVQEKYWLDRMNKMTGAME